MWNHKLSTIVLALIYALNVNCFARELRDKTDDDIVILDKLTKGEKILLDSTLISSGLIDETVIVGDDTVSIIIPQKNYGRFDRGLYNFMFIPKGQWGFGLTASYGEFNTDDSQLLSILKDLDLKIKAYSIKPSISYFFDNNQAVGLQFNYSRTITDLSGLSVDFDDDINFSLHDVSYYSESYAASAFYRYYVGLGKMKRFAVFNEVELSFGSGTSRFKRIYNSEPRDTRTNSTTASLNFSPGLCVFIQDNVSFNISFGVFGIHAKHEKQWVDDVKAGSRTSSGANFKFNIFNINFGMGVYI